MGGDEREAADDFVIFLLIGCPLLLSTHMISASIIFPQVLFLQYLHHVSLIIYIYIYIYIYP